MRVHQAALHLTKLCFVPALLLGSCSTDERTLSYGVGIGSAGHHAGTSGSSRAGAGDGGDGQGGTPDDSSGGAPLGGSSGSGGMPPAAAGSATINPNGVGGSASGEVGGGASGSGSSGTAASGGSGGNSNGGTGSGDAGGSGGSGGSPELNPDTGPCGDLDHNGTQDCDETLVANAAFQQAITGWVAEANLAQTWNPQDARSQAGSGSLALTSTQVGSSGGWGIVGTGQCLTATAGEIYEVGARAFIPPSQGDGHAAVNVVIFGNDGCQGTVLKAASPALLGAVGAWQVIKGELKMPPATRSIYVRLAAEKPGAQSSLEVHFDDILIRKK